jgi:hypothetical protein
VAEFGGEHNIKTAVDTVTRVLEIHGIDAGTLNPWYFPSAEEYSKLLERLGFDDVHTLVHDRPTVLPDGENGIYHWLDMFMDVFFDALPLESRHDARDQAVSLPKPMLLRDGNWVIDYRRLRVFATKPLTQATSGIL